MLAYLHEVTLKANHLSRLGCAGITDGPVYYQLDCKNLALLLTPLDSASRHDCCCAGFFTSISKVIFAAETGVKVLGKSLRKSDLATAKPPNKCTSTV